MKNGLDRATQILNSLKGNVVVGISGGIDSMCLLSLMLKSNIKKECVRVVHVDHNLRADSKKDKEFVQAFCAKFGLKIEVFSADILKMAAKSGRSIETEARAFRHNVFQRMANNFNAKILLAHNASDQAETVLMHIFRGCGMDGLRGMSEFDGNIVRPLINLTRQDIEKYASQNFVEFVEDCTNLDTRFSRNFVRSIIKKIETKYQSATKHINRLSRIVAQDQSQNTLFLDLISNDNDVVLLDKRALKEPQAHQYIIKALRATGLSTDYEFKHIQAIASLAATQTGKKINLPHNIICANERLSLAFFKANTIKPRSTEVELKEGENIIDGIRVLAQEVDDISPIKGEIIVDAEKIKGAVLRFRQSGDIFCPCNSKRKKLKDFLVERGVENRLKDKIPLICNGKNVLVVCSIELSDSVKVDKNTSRALRIVLDGKN